MITVKDAYNLFKKRFPNARTETIYDWGDFYLLGTSLDGDMIDDDYKIDKNTGEISEMDFLEYMEESKKHEDDVIEIKVKSFL